MNVCECVISCKSGDQVIYRGVKKEDAEALYQHQCTIAQETYFTSLYPEELLYNIEGKVERIKEIQNHPVLGNGNWKQPDETCAASGKREWA